MKSSEKLWGTGRPRAPRGGTSSTYPNNDGHWYEAVFDDFRTICGNLGDHAADAVRKRGEGGRNDGRTALHLIWSAASASRGTERRSKARGNMRPDAAAGSASARRWTRGCTRRRRAGRRTESELLRAGRHHHAPGALQPRVLHADRRIDRNGNAGRDSTEGSAEAVADLARWLVPPDARLAPTLEHLANLYMEKARPREETIVEGRPPGHEQRALPHVAHLAGDRHSPPGTSTRSSRRSPSGRCRAWRTAPRRSSARCSISPSLTRSSSSTRARNSSIRPRRRARDSHPDRRGDSASSGRCWMESRAARRYVSACA